MHGYFWQNRSEPVHVNAVTIVPDCNCRQLSCLHSKTRHRRYKTICSSACKGLRFASWYAVCDTRYIQGHGVKKTLSCGWYWQHGNWGEEYFSSLPVLHDKFDEEYQLQTAYKSIVKTLRCTSTSAGNIAVRIAKSCDVRNLLIFWMISGLYK